MLTIDSNRNPSEVKTMPTTRTATLDTDTRSFPLSFASPLTIKEIAQYVERTYLHPEGRYDVSPCVTMGADNIAHVTLSPVGDSLHAILSAI